MKKALIVAVIASLALSGILAQQPDKPAKTEKTVEEAYLTETYEGKIILEYAQGDTKGMKQDALLYIKEAIDDGRKGEDIQRALSYLALDGTTYVTREGGYGRVKNNYPDVRAKACEYLGLLGTESARAALIKVTYGDNEPMVVAAAIRGLGVIGNNDDDRVTDVIAYVVNRYDILYPDNTLAFEALIAVDRLAEKNDGMDDSAAIKMVMRIADGNYITPVKTKAKEILSRLRKYSGGSKGK